MQARHRRTLLTVATAVAMGCTCAFAQSPQKVAAQKKPPVADKSKPGGQSIFALVNDDPITAWEVEQRTNLLAANAKGGGGDLKAKAEARWQQIVKDPKTNERFQQLLREKNVRSKEEAMAVQQTFVKGLQQNMIEQLRREARATIMPQLRKAAQDELIEERLKLQEAKKIGLELTDDDVRGIIKGLAESNKMTEEQFANHVKGVGFDISTLKNRFKAQIAWREVIRRRYGSQVAVNQRDVDRAISTSANASGEDTVELQVHKISLPLPSSLNQGLIARRYAEADALRAKFAGCKSMPELARTVGDARFDDLKFIKPASVAEPTRSMLLSAKDGDMLPPLTAAGGIEVYAVCSRRAIKADEKQQQKAAEDLQAREFEVHSRRHLFDLKQDAHIEYR